MTPWVTRIIIANAVMFVLCLSSPELAEQLTLVPLLALSRPWTIITYMFLHGGISHIFFNMLALFFFGTRLEHELGTKQFLWLYFVSGVMAAVLSFLFAPGVAIIGASGAVYGIMFGFAYLWPREQIYIWGIFPLEARWLVAIMLAISLISGFGSMDGGIAHFAHLGGFVGGFLYLRWISRHGSVVAIDLLPRQPPPPVMHLDRWSKIDREKLHSVNREELDRILGKITATGTGSLTPREVEFLNRFSQE